MSISKLLAIAAVAGLATAFTAKGDYIATTGVNTITNTDSGAPGASVGDTFSVSGGTFTSYSTFAGPGSSPALNGNDLGNYRYDLSGTVQSVTGNNATYTGLYQIYYLNGANQLNVSSGTAALSASFFAPNNATFNGVLTEANPDPHAPFGDLGPIAYFVGTYMGGVSPLGDPLTGTIAGAISNNAGAVTPLPSSATAGLALMGSFGLLQLRRRKQATA